MATTIISISHSLYINLKGLHTKMLKAEYFSIVTRNKPKENHN